jgi:hypothetical protein
MAATLSFTAIAKLNGEAVEADTATMADTTNTWAVQRTDTHATAVAVPASPSHDDPTVYGYTMGNPEDGVIYRASFKFTKGALTWYQTVDAEVAAVGQIITQQDVVDFLARKNLAILSQQDPNATALEPDNTQRAINKAEAMAKAILGNTFKIPLAVSGVAVINATSGVAYPLLVAACVQFAGFWLNKWRSIQALSGDQLTSAARINWLAAAWEKNAQDNLRMMVRWAQGYSDGLAVDLDMRDDAPRLVESGAIAAVQAVVPATEQVYASGGAVVWPVIP